MQQILTRRRPTDIINKTHHSTTMDRSSLIKKIQFVLFDEYDESLSVLNAKFFGGYYNEMSDEELLDYYEELRYGSKNLQYQ